MSEASFLAIGMAFLVAACAANGGDPPPRRPDRDEDRLAERLRMVDVQLRARDIVDPLVLEAMASVPRHRFVPEDMAAYAYDDRPLPIGQGQTISQPYIVALMTQLVRPREGTRALDVGTGSGYQAAVLAACGARVHSIEILPRLAESATLRLDRLGYAVTVRAGDGWAGWSEVAPFDAIVVAAATRQVPPALVEQLAPGGRMVLPVGDLYQALVLVEKDEEGRVTKSEVTGVRFVPMTGEAESAPR